MSSTPFVLALRHASLPWLLATALVTAAPHARYQPLWLGVMAGLVLVAVFWKWRRGYKTTPRPIKALLAFGGLFGILLHYGSLLGYEAGIALLALTLTLKLLELQSRRDAVVVVTLAYFLLLTHFFYAQGIIAAVWLLLGLWIVTATLVRLYDDPERSVPPLLAMSARLIGQAMPLMLILYLFVPRIEGPLWGLPQAGLMSRTGLSDSITPGSIAELVRNDDIAFRVRFHDRIPAPRERYWRGPVLSFFDGRTWRRGYGSNVSPHLAVAGTPLVYSLTLEPHDQNWVLALEMTPRPPEIADGMRLRVNSSGSLIAFRPISSRRRFDLVAYPDYRLDAEADPLLLRANLQLPGGRNPRARALAATWRTEVSDPRQLAARTLAYFRQGFTYTLEPQILGDDAVDDFLFDSKRGFCEHYASAFVWLMRAAGVPARIVAGYQGGEFNGDYFVVRQSDAHAWAEIWLQGEGWQRVDPTAAVPAEMTDASVRELAAATTHWLTRLKNRWEAVGNLWNQWVLGYSQSQQYDLLAALGIDKPNWRSLALTLAATMGVAFIALALWLFRPRRDADVARRVWRRACRHLERRGIACPAWETPLALAQRLEREAPKYAAVLRPLAKLVSASRYGSEPRPTSTALYTALKTLRRF